ncbi:hypothetical protein BDQ12DRAFT_674119 [Crucibulum laeve]|uniref:Uncharacterized protein n=1 Tax=Crucibulum laeve TaxID=68775 RepID=A0A5C3MK85_9AGAR|nr:hypothetical protein BDQ12DRAFT_674119 [Crucibulum laeve]
MDFYDHKASISAFTSPPTLCFSAGVVIASASASEDQKLSGRKVPRSPEPSPAKGLPKRSTSMESFALVVSSVDPASSVGSLSLPLVADASCPLAVGSPDPLVAAAASCPLASPASRSTSGVSSVAGSLVPSRAPLVASCSFVVSLRVPFDNEMLASSFIFSSVPAVASGSVPCVTPPSPSAASPTPFTASFFTSSTASSTFDSSTASSSTSSSFFTSASTSSAFTTSGSHCLLPPLFPFLPPFPFVVADGGAGAEGVVGVFDGGGEVAVAIGVGGAVVAVGMGGVAVCCCGVINVSCPIGSVGVDGAGGFFFVFWVAVCCCCCFVFFVGFSEAGGSCPVGGSVG